MIEMIETSSISICLRIDLCGVKEILSYIEELKNDRTTLRILHSGINKSFEIENNNDINEVFISKECIKIYMDDEEVEYFEQRLKDALTSKAFYPSEVCERYYKRKHVTLYCEVI